ncbi:MAG: NBR1-Ig-like domain-containing protein [Anaerolineae bacterium]
MRYSILLAAVLLTISGVILATQAVAQQPPCCAPSLSAQDPTPTATKVCPTLEPEMQAIPEDDWYRYQGDDTAGDHKTRNAYCGQACVAMAIEKVTGKPIKITLIADHVGKESDEKTDSNDLKVALDKWGVDYIPIRDMSTMSQAVRDRGHIVIAVVKMSKMTEEGPDCDGKGNSPEQHCHKYRSHSGGHWMVVHTLTDDAEWVIVHDPYVFRSPPDRTYWYSNGLPKGRNRYYLYSEFQGAFEYYNQPALEITGPDWYRYQGEDSAGAHKDENAYCGQTCLAMAIQYLTEQTIPISRIVSRAGAGPDQVLGYQDMKKALGDWEVDYEAIQDMGALRQAVQDRRNIALARIDMSKISRGSDLGKTKADARKHYDKYADPHYDPPSSHWVVVRGMTEDRWGKWVIVHDPYVFDDDIYRYSRDRDMPRGRNRYYAYSEFESALASDAVLEITGLAGTETPLAPVLYKQSEFAILEPGEAIEIYFILLNAGSQTWEAGHYALVNVNDQPLGAPSQMALDVDVPSRSRVTWRFSITAPAVPCVYRSEWRFSYDGDLFGPSLWTSVIVIPGDSGDLAELIRSLIEDALQRGEEWLERQWEELRRQIIEMIEAEMERRAEEFNRDLCGGPAATMIISLAVVWLGRRRSRVANRNR